MSAAERILDRLTKVRALGNGRWVAACPAHPDRSPSLRVTEKEDGRVLIKDFGGCDIEAVMGALGLGMSDLFERPLGVMLTPAPDRLSATEAVIVIDHEVLVSVIILDEVLHRCAVSPAQIKRLSQASARIGTARDLVHPLKVVARA